MKPRSKRDRTQQIANWLAHKYPTRKPVYVSWNPDLKHISITTKNRISWTIQFNPKYPLFILEDSLLHEWAHIRKWSDLLEHPDAWGEEYAMYYRDYYDGIGGDESCTYRW